MTFNWDTGTGVSHSHLYVGTGGAAAQTSFHRTPAPAVSHVVNNLPTNGSTVYVRLGLLLTSGWQYKGYTYTTAGI